MLKIRATLITILLSISTASAYSTKADFLPRPDRFLESADVAGHPVRMYPALPLQLAQSVGPNEAAAIVWRNTGYPVIYVEYSGGWYYVTVQMPGGGTRTYYVDSQGRFSDG